MRTIPDALQSLDDADQIRANLQSAGLSVHFLGGADVAALEAIEVSAELCSGPRILYQPFGISLTADEGIGLPMFEKQLKTAPGQYQRLEGKNDQELIALIDEQITRSEPTPEMDFAPLQLALVCEDLDFEAVRRLQGEILARHRLAVDLLRFLGTRLKAMERLRKWQEFLTRRQALIFYHGASEKERLEPLWLKAQQATNRPPCGGSSPNPILKTSGATIPMRFGISISWPAWSSGPGVLYELDARFYSRER